MRKAWQGGPILPRALPGRRSLTRLRLLSDLREGWSSSPDKGLD